MEIRKRKRFTRTVLIAGGKYKDTNETIKSINETIGNKMPTRAQYDDDSFVKDYDQIVRVVLSNGMIHYLKKGCYILKT